MIKKKLLSVLLLTVLTAMVGCSSDKEVAEEKTQPELKQEVVETGKKIDDLEEDGDEEENAEFAEVSADEDLYIHGNVIVKEDEKIIRVEGETNLIEGMTVKVNLLSAFESISGIIGKVGSEKGEVERDGTVTIDYPVGDDFFEKYNGRYVEVKIVAETNRFNDEFVEAYGEHGEKMTGPFIYQYELAGLGQKLYAPVYILVGDAETEYAIETPERDPLPEDYGETNIWIDAEVVDNDHRYLYVEGKTNILEGVRFYGEYYSDEEATFSQESFGTEIYVEPDGTFLLPVKYKSITEEGYIKIHSAPVRTHRTKEMIYDTYGENFENLTGDVVKEEDDHQEIELILKTEGMDVDAPEDSLVTEDNGELKIQVPDDVLFDFDKSDLKDESKTTLDEVIAILEELDDNRDIQINGHTDNEGDADYNLNLSKERAASVEKYLKKHGDIDHLNITTEGYGETKPVESNEDEEGQKRNRRVEIVFNE